MSIRHKLKQHKSSRSSQNAFVRCRLLIAEDFCQLTKRTVPFLVRRLVAAEAVISNTRVLFNLSLRYNLQPLKML
jgi:hypothetical protein